ncbi:nicotinate-nucleotide--dimethylbenzimidazole phosphoribosyltransferase [Natronosporangium hydrolyticum]|uniref:Nicotinate-nucleotide--dimethylbenzimidazole phosphoribosyltransferase n=1 Tax=Natronosporangium hydrolyticum TaxID=2811111 RepID=A0A895YRA8_9ACTN|nr:nicotinate-nucleotide--dimethylbenzimidazole phosphoribosyltransferase [Natronosporangium hydrolyticum]
MTTLVAAVHPIDQAAADAARDRHARLAKPAGSLGRLEEVGAQLAAIAGACPPPPVDRPGLVIAAADHGVHVQQVTPWPQQVTAAMVETFRAGRATANALAALVGAEVAVLDAGVVTPLADGEAAAGAAIPLVRAGIRAGTEDITAADAMTLPECVAAVQAGAATADSLLDRGIDLLIGGDMGIANTTAAAALIAAYTGASAEAVTGRGTGVDDPTYRRKQEVVAKAVARHRAQTTAPRAGLPSLAALGGLEHAALTGVLLAGAARRVPVLLDGVNAVAAALAATAICPPVAGYLIAGHRSAEPGASAGLAQLGLSPLLELEMRLGEGTGALAAVGLVRAAATVLREVATLDELGLAGG